MKSALTRLLSLVTIATAASSASCTDPVRDQAIADLGPEDGPGPGPEHRPGQPCLLCHSDGGPAQAKPFAIAGTVFQSAKPGIDKGADQITVQFVDARGGGPLQIPETGPSGNFYVPLQDWPDIAFPIRVAIYKDINGPPTQTMKSLISREGSCNFCHRPNIDEPTEDEVQKSRNSAGQIYLK